MADQMASFDRNTSLIRVPLPVLTKPTGGGLVRLDLPKTGLLANLWLRVAVTIAGSLSAPNALGVSSVIRSVRLITNSSVEIFRMSGAGYSYLLQEVLDSEYHLAQGQNQGRVAVTATNFNLDMVIPVQINRRDPVGLIMLQNDQTLVTLEIDFEADATVATGATVTATVTPVMEYFTVPTDPRNWPNLNIIHQIQEETVAIAATGQYIYNVPRGATYTQLLHGLGIGVSGADGFTQFQRRVNNSVYMQDSTPGNLDMEQRYLRGRARPAGAVLVDLMGSSGLGNYGLLRDFFNSQQVTQYDHIFQVGTIGTLYTVRRQLVPLQG